MKIYPLSKPITPEDIGGSNIINIVYCYTGEKAVYMGSVDANHRWTREEYNESDRNNKIKVLGWFPGNESKNIDAWMEEEFMIPADAGPVTQTINKRKIRVDEAVSNEQSTVD